ncbi:MAG: PAS domain S-box protein, partial [Planctomycetes bacterium]|nr:PAS domain S-box protein [Planctomycetota bacterium]
MVRINLLRSVVFRLAAALIVGGVAMSAVLNLLELRSSEANLQIVVTQDAGRVVRSVQSVLKNDPALWSRHELVELLPALSSDTPLVGMRLTRISGERVEIGTIPPPMKDANNIWVLHEWGVPKGNEVSITQLTRVQAPFMSAGQRCMLEMIVDGTEARGNLEKHLRTQMQMQWLVLTVITLFGMFFFRRWIGAPLMQIVQLVNTKAGPRPFNEMARRTHGEFSDLASAIGGMLEHLEETGDALTRSERAFRDLYELAPAAMLSLDAKGNIREANPRAAILLGAESDRALLGQPLIDFVRPEDRGLLRQAMDRLYLDPVTRCELRLGSSEKSIDAAIECAGVRSEDGVLQGAHLSMLDMCESKQLQRQVAHKSHLLNLVLDHISSAILLVDSNNKIAAHNQKLTALSHSQARILVGQHYDAETFWHNLG